MGSSAASFFSRVLRTVTSVPSVMILSESSSGRIGGRVLWVKAQPRDPYFSIGWFSL